ncbi:protein ABHD13-like [Ptychodera flava]|uniref:protein ABHD13-like n=1 Tax=Ptychodera flava TaxID=63121 RepID=UPI00396A25A3
MKSRVYAGTYGDHYNPSMAKPKLRKQDSRNEDTSEKVPVGRPAKHTGYDLIEFVGRLVLNIMLKFWRLCSAGVLLLFLFYWQYGGVLVFTLMCSAFFGILYNYQDSLLYYPDQPESSRMYVMSPRIFGVPYENLFIKTSDGVNINAILLKQRPEIVAQSPTIIFLHGNAGNIGHRLLNAQALYSYCGSNVLLVEYRGYGRSEGYISESGFYTDAKAAVDYLLSRSDIDPTKLIIFGRSLGGAVAIDLASSPGYRDQLAALIVENTFTSVPDMAGVVFNLPVISWVPLWCHKNKYLSIKKIHRVKAPTLFLSGMADELIPPKMMHILFQTSGAVLKRLAKFDNGTHNETFQCEGYFETFAHFIKEVTKSAHGSAMATGHSGDRLVTMETATYEDV